MLFTIFVLFCLGSIIQSSAGSAKTRCAVVIYVNQSSFNTEADFSDYVEKIQGLSSNRTNVYFSDDPDLFIVRHGRFIDAPGLFALESQKFPGMFLRKANHSMVLDNARSSVDFENDATFLMDHTKRNETYTTLKLFSHRSWRLSTPRDSNSALFFDDYKDNIAPSRTSELLVVAQPCPKNVTERKQVVKSSQLASNVQPIPRVKLVMKNKWYKQNSSDTPNRLKKGSRSHGDLLRDVTMKPPLPTDATLNINPNTKYLTAITNKGNLKSIPNEYSFDNFEVPDFIMNSLTENAKSANDGVEAPKPEMKPATVVESRKAQQSVKEHTNKLPTTKQKISELSSLIFDDPDIDDIENNLKDLQYGSKGCKLLVAEDTMEEDATSKDKVPNPNAKKACKDEFPQACMEMAKKGYCLAFKSLMSSVCRKSCNLCSRLLDTGFTSCTKTCGGGRQMRMIKINRREYLQTRRCNAHPCPINGGYSEFGPYTECSVTCGEGVKYRRRTCSNPKPQYNGKPCRRLGPSIESKPCHAGKCPQKQGNRKKLNKTKTKIGNLHHHKAALHIDGPHADHIHQHSILLQGRKIAKLRCTPRRGELSGIIHDNPTKRFIVHPLKTKIHSSKKSNIEESEIVYNREGLPVDTARTIIKAFKSPYKIILARKGSKDMKLLEECIEDDDRLNEEDGEGKHHEDNLVYTKPDEKSYSDFDEYQYEPGNIVTPQVTSSYNKENNDYSAIPKGTLFGEPKGLDLVLSKMNSISPRVNDELSKEQNLESSFKMENVPSMNAFPFIGAEDSDQEGDDTNTDKENYGYNVETLPNR